MSNNQEEAYYQDTHTLKLPVNLTLFEEKNFERNLSYANQLSNATLGDLLKKYNAYKQDNRTILLNSQYKEYKETKNNQTSSYNKAYFNKNYKELLEEYSLTKTETQRIMFNHARVSVQIEEHLPASVILALINEVWTNFNEYMQGNKGEPKYTPIKSRTVLWGSNAYNGLCFKENTESNHGGKLTGYRYHNTVYILHYGSNSMRDKKRKIHNKSMRISISLTTLPYDKREYYKQLFDYNFSIKYTSPKRLIKTTGLKKEIIRGKTKYYILIVINAKPYRNPKNKIILEDKATGLDLGISTLTYHTTTINQSSSNNTSSDNESSSSDQSSSKGFIQGIVKLNEKSLSEYKKNELKLRKERQAQERSRRNNNPQNYNPNKLVTDKKTGKKKRKKGTSIKGKKTWVNSKAYNQRQLKIKELERKQATLRLEETRKQVKELVLLTHSKTYNIENVSLEAWKQNKKWSKRLGLTTPGRMISLLEYELAQYGGSLVLLNTQALALTQECFCGVRASKELSNRIHCCENTKCYLYNLEYDRDIFSSILASIVIDDKLPHLDKSTKIGKHNAELLFLVQELKVIGTERATAVNNINAVQPDGSTVSNAKDITTIEQRDPNGDLHHIKPTDSNTIQSCEVKPMREPSTMSGLEIIRVEYKKSPNNNPQSNHSLK